MENPVGKPTLEIRSVRLAKEDPGSEILEPLPVVDEFGQWILADWPGKIKSLPQLKAEWAQEEKELGPGDFNYCRYGGYLGTKAKATGFFRVEKLDGKWWFVDADGHLFFSVSSNGMRGGGAETRTAGRESYYAALPPPAAVQCVEYAPAIRREWDAKWVDFAIRRLSDWGSTPSQLERRAPVGHAQESLYRFSARLGCGNRLHGNAGRVRAGVPAGRR